MEIMLPAKAWQPVRQAQKRMRDAKDRVIVASWTMGPISLHAKMERQGSDGIHTSDSWGITPPNNQQETQR